MTKSNILSKLTPHQALDLLHILVDEDKQLCRKIVEKALEMFQTFDIDDVASEVYDSLNFLSTDELFDSSGKKSYGYVDPNECAFEMVEGAVEPFIQQMRKLIDLELNEQAIKYCKGILKGIYKYKQEAENDFADWAADAPDTIIENIMYFWEENVKDNNDIEEIEKFIKENLKDL